MAYLSFSNPQSEMNLVDLRSGSLELHPGFDDGEGHGGCGCNAASCPPGKEGIHLPKFSVLETGCSKILMISLAKWIPIAFCIVSEMSTTACICSAHLLALGRMHKVDPPLQSCASCVNHKHARGSNLFFDPPHSSVLSTIGRCKLSMKQPNS